MMPAHPVDQETLNYIQDSQDAYEAHFAAEVAQGLMIQQDERRRCLELVEHVTRRIQAGPHYITTLAALVCVRNAIADPEYQLRGANS